MKVDTAPSLYQSGLSAIAKGGESVRAGADAIQQSFRLDSPADPVDGAVKIKLGSNQVAAGAALIKVAVELDQKLLDILA